MMSFASTCPVSMSANSQEDDSILKFSIDSILAAAVDLRQKSIQQEQNRLQDCEVRIFGFLLIVSARLSRSASVVLSTNLANNSEWRHQFLLFCLRVIMDKKQFDSILQLII